jgi:hypothetical protein
VYTHPFSAGYNRLLFFTAKHHANIATQTKAYLPSGTQLKDALGQKFTHPAHLVAQETKLCTVAPHVFTIITTVAYLHTKCVSVT